MSQNESNPLAQSFDTASRYAMLLSLMEVGLGSFLHAFRVPFSGFFLSLNQCFILNRAVIYSRTSSLPMTISNTAAILKTLSPYGKKFTPMLAISMQGLLFNLGTMILGNHLLGRCFGSLLLGLWPMVQPALIYGIIYGSILLNMASYYNQMLSKLPWFNGLTIQTIAAGYIFMHLFLSLSVCLLTYFLPTRVFDRYDRYILSYRTLQVEPKSVPSKITFRKKMRGVLKDFLSPFFLLSLLLSGIFFYATVNSFEAFLLLFLRLIAVAFLTFFLLRNISAEWCIRTFSKMYLLNRYTPYVKEVLEKLQRQ